MLKTITNKGIKMNLILPLIFAIIFILLNTFIGVAQVSANDTGESENHSKSEEMLMLGMIDLTLLFNDSSGNIEDIDIEDQFKDNIVINGRTAFFLKGKIKGKYLVTARLDTGQGEISELWQDLFSQSNGNTISRIDPERYYPVYGDDSSVVNMVDSQGKLYLDIAWDDTEVIWGNYRYNINNTQLLKYNRSLYGFKFKTELAKDTEDVNIKGEDLQYKDIRDKNIQDEVRQGGNIKEGKEQKGDKHKENIQGKDSKTTLKGFWSKTERVHTYNELKLTGGMLYYLKHGNLIVGSENIKVEIRDSFTAEVEKTKDLTAGLDYKIDYLSGRIILLNDTPGIDYLYKIEDDQESAYLVAEYEYEPLGSIDQHSSFGINMEAKEKGAKLSGTYTIETTAAGKRYIARGISYNYQSNSSKTTIEWANSQNKLANQYISEDGGMSYSLKNNISDVDNANAYLVQYQTNLKDLNPGLAGLDMKVGYSHKDKGFSNQEDGIEEDIDSFNLEFKGGNQQRSYTTRYYIEKREDSGKSDVIDLELNNKVNEKLNLISEIRHKTTEDQDNQSSTQLSTELNFIYKIDENKEMYGGQELSLKGDKLNKTTLGAKVKPRENITLDAAVTLDNGSDSKDRDALKLGGSYQYKYGEVYSAFLTEGAAAYSLIVGGTTAVDDRTELYIEQKTTNDHDEDSKSNLLGLKRNLNDNWSLALDYSRSNVIKEDDTELSRDIITPAAVYRGDNLNYKIKGEYRRERGDEVLDQYVLRSGVDMKYNQELSILFNLDYSLTERDSDIEQEDSFTEAQFGLAYRPINNDRLNLLAMYTYQEEYSPEDQENTAEYNERSNIFSLEGIYDLNARWQLGEKIAWKNSQLLTADLSASSDTYLWVNRLSYRANADWDLYGEYRILESRQAEDSKSGLLLGINKGLGNNLKLGVGYNFTDFNDDLTDLDYNYRGLFINLVKKW